MAFVIHVTGVFSRKLNGYFWQWLNGIKKVGWLKTGECKSPLRIVK